MTGGEILLECLKAQGVRAVFGMPGTQNLAIYDAFHQAGGGISHYLVRNEQAATMMAGGFARASGEVGVALTVPGPGASNAATGIGDAFTDCQPVLLVTGGVERFMQHRDRSKMFHGLDQQSFFRPIVRYYGCPQSAAQIPQVVRAAFSAIWAGRPGPAVIEIPPDVAAEDGGQPCIPDRFARRFDRTPDATDVRRAAALLRDSARPAILIGGDVIASGASATVERLATRLGAPVLHTRLGMCALPTSFPLNFGNSRHKRAKSVLTAADCLIAIGVRFTQIDSSNWRMPTPPRLVQIDRDAAEIGRELPATAGVVGDLSPAIEAIETELGDRSVDGWGDQLAAIRAGHRPPRRPVLSDIRDVLPATGIVACDVTSLTYRGFDEFPVSGPRTYLYPCHYVTMGYGLPAAIGAKVACPDRPVVAFCGDGGVLMSIGELATIAQYRIGVVIVVVNDGALLAIKASQIKHYDSRIIDTELVNPDFVGLARSFGLNGRRVADLAEFRSVLSECLSKNAPTLIEVPLADHQAEIMQQIPWLSGE
jgi:acetolactate synthase-1/2/3 large subunit